jgi:protein involved in polysaccharide export with SLBB domain
MTVTADPSVLASHPGDDPLLEDGDVIFIPQRPSTVSVMGEVMQPGTFQFDPKMSAKDYIRRAGGFGDDAEEDEAFVVYPDGTAQRITSSWLGSDSDVLPPGSVIYVPRDLFPIDWLALSTTLADILKDFAVSAASLAVLHQAN